MTQRSRKPETSQTKQEEPRNPFADPPASADQELSDRAADDPMGSVSPDRAGELSDDDKRARDMAAAMDQSAAEAVVRGNEAVSPDRVGALSAADQKAADAVPKSTPESIERAQDKVDAEREKKRAEADPDYVAGARVRCYSTGCILPELIDGYGLCGNHWANRPDLRKRAHAHSVEIHEKAKVAAQKRDAGAAKGETDG